MDTYVTDICADEVPASVAAESNSSTKANGSAISRNVRNSVVQIDCGPPAGSEQEQRCNSSTVRLKRRTTVPISNGAIAQLFEWRYSDIAVECERLGAEGWMAVEVSPPAAHLTLGSRVAAEYMESLHAEEPPIYSWMQRLLPIDLMQLDSRSGTALELETAATTCASHGVQLFASVSLNAMASVPCCDRMPSMAGTSLSCAAFGFDARAVTTPEDASSTTQLACPRFMEYP